MVLWMSNNRAGVCEKKIQIRCLGLTSKIQRLYDFISWGPISSNHREQTRLRSSMSKSATIQCGISPKTGSSYRTAFAARIGAAAGRRSAIGLGKMLIFGNTGVNLCKYL